MNFTEQDVKTGSERLGNWLAQELYACEDAKAPLSVRWAFNESVNRNDPKNAGKKLYQNWEPRAFPILSAYVNRTTESTISALLAPKPWVQAVPDDDDQEGADDLERGCQTVMERAGFDRKIEQAVRTALLCGISHLRMRMTSSGIALDYIHPNDFVVGPLFCTDLRRAHLVGHRFYLPRWELRDRATKQDGDDSALYDIIDAEEVDKLPSSDPDLNPSGRDPGYDRSDAQQASSEKDNDLIELWEVIARVTVGKTPKMCRFVMCLAADRQARIVLYEPYGDGGADNAPYSRPWYFDLRFHDEPGKYFPAGSYSQDVIGLCLAVQDSINLSLVGETANVAPPVVVSGGTLGKKIKTVTLGQVIEVLNPDVKVQAFPSTFDSSRLVALNDQLDNRIQAQTGVSQSRLSSEYLASQTATATAAMEGASAQNEGGKPRFLANFIEEMWTFLKDDLLRLHAPTFRKVYGRALSEPFYTAARKSAVRFVATGKDAQHLPHIQIPKLMAAKQIAMEPGSEWSARRVNDAIMSRLDLGIDLGKLRKDDEEKAEEQAQLEAQAQMALAQGGAGLAAPAVEPRGAAPQQPTGGPGGLGALAG